MYCQSVRSGLSGLGPRPLPWSQRGAQTLSSKLAELPTGASLELPPACLFTDTSAFLLTLSSEVSTDCPGLVLEELSSPSARLR